MPRRITSFIVNTKQQELNDRNFLTTKYQDLCFFAQAAGVAVGGMAMMLVANVTSFFPSFFLSQPFCVERLLESRSGKVGQSDQ